MHTGPLMPGARIDFEKFRLRRFVDRLIEIGEVEVHEEPVSLARLSAIIESTPRATLFRSVGPQKFELVAAVAGSRKRLAAGLRIPGQEFGFVGTLRGEAVPMVRGVTNGVPAPADAEMIIEGYFDELGFSEIEGPYGEFFGYYGAPHIDPVFHVTAITMRKDMLHQSVRHSGLRMGETEGANLGARNAESVVWRTLRAANIDPAAVHATPAANGRQHVRPAAGACARRSSPDRCTSRTSCKPLAATTGARSRSNSTACARRACSSAPAAAANGRSRRTRRTRRQAGPPLPRSDTMAGGMAASLEAT